MELAQCRLLTIILRVIQLLLAFTCVGLVVNYSSYTVTVKTDIVDLIVTKTVINDSRILSYLTATSTYLTVSFLLLIATIHSDSFEHMRKSIFEMVYNIFGAIVQGINSIVLLSMIGGVSKIGVTGGGFYAAGVLGLINAALYFVTFFISMKARQAT